MYSWIRLIYYLLNGTKPGFSFKTHTVFIHFLCWCWWGRGGCSISSSVLVLKNVKDPVLPRMIEFVYFPWFKFSSKNVSKHHVFLGRHYLHRCQSVTALFSDVVVELIPYLLHNWGWKSSPRPSCESCSTENLRFPWHFYCCEDTQWSNATRRSTCRTSPCN